MFNLCEFICVAVLPKHFTQRSNIFISQLEPLATYPAMIKVGMKLFFKVPTILGFNDGNLGNGEGTSGLNHRQSSLEVRCHANLVPSVPGMLATNHVDKSSFPEPSVSASFALGLAID